MNIYRSSIGVKCVSASLFLSITVCLIFLSLELPGSNANVGDMFC